MALFHQIKTVVPLNPLAEKPSEPIKSTASKAQEPKPPAKPVIEKPKAQASQPVEPSGRGRKPSDDPREKLSTRLPASLIRDLDAQHPDWKAQIETLLRTHFKPNQF